MVQNILRYKSNVHSIYIFSFSFILHYSKPSCYIGLCWHLLLKYSSLNREAFFFFPENATLIFYCIILWKRPWSIIIFTFFEAAEMKKRNEMFQQYIYSFRHFYVSSAFSPCVFRIKIRFCQFSLQGKIKSQMVLSDYKVFLDL